VANLSAAIIEHANISRGASVCDIGCGYGALARDLSCLHGARVTGYTLSAKQLQAAVTATRESSDPAPRFLLGDWLENDLANGAMDAALSIECISHVADKTGFLAQCARVLVPGGRLVLCDWIAADDPCDWEIEALLEPICREGLLAGIATLGEYRVLLEGAGFRILEARDLGPQVRRTWETICCRLVKRSLTKRAYQAALLDELAGRRAFALTIVRLVLGYRLRALGYGFLVAEKI
ncbi:MAG: methyltransferase domain-containing protein, partial [Verrucomicrobiales bacterium]